MKEIEKLLAGMRPAQATALLGVLDGIDAEGRVRFRPDGETGSVPALLAVDAGDAELLRAAREGRRAVALRTAGDPAGDPPGGAARVVLVGLLRERVAGAGVPDPDPDPDADGEAARAVLAAPGVRPEEAVIDGKRVRFEAREEIVLRCGKGSITLRQDGKIVIKGTHLLSRASGVNRIKGGQVNIN